MTPISEHQLLDIATVFKDGGVIAYPTEAVFGLGCDPLSESAALKVLSLKGRPVKKGMILIASNYSQVSAFVDDDKIPFERRPEIFSSWPGPITWLLPKSRNAPSWVTGDSDMIAVRVTEHQVVCQLCDYLASPLISTSANPAGLAPAQTPAQVSAYFSDAITVIDAPVGGQTRPSQIRHCLTGEVLRT